MGFYGDYILPRIVDAGGGMKAVSIERARCLADVRGRVLEVGFGTGLNLPHYPRGVEAVVGVDPSGPSAKLARKRIAQAPFPVEFVAVEAERIAAANASFDSVVCTFSLCTIADPHAALAHMRRVLKPGGRLFFLEHGRSDEPKVQRWQERLNGLQGRIFGGCHLNREIDHLVADAGFAIDSLERYYVKGPKAMAYYYRGVAHAAGGAATRG